MDFPGSAGDAAVYRHRRRSSAATVELAATAALRLAPDYLWQAVGILALCRILFGGFGHRGFYRSNFRRRMSERWEQMTPEERERFRQGIRARCGFGPSASERKGQWSHVDSAQSNADLFRPDRQSRRRDRRLQRNRSRDRALPRREPDHRSLATNTHSEIDRSFW